jgi:CBS domain-containing protein
MKVREIMTSPVQACMPETDLATVVSMMWARDCGIIPVVNPDQHVIGVLTDRDICMAVATRGGKRSREVRQAAPVIPGARVADLCAAPGGKTLGLAAKGAALVAACDLAVADRVRHP